MELRPIILVLEYKLDRKGNCAPQFIERLKVAVTLAQSDKRSLLVITGGQTRAEFPSEAETAHQWIKRFYPELAPRVTCETEARSTAEHPQLIKKLLRILNINPRSITIVTNKVHVRRSEFLFRVHLPQWVNKIVFVRDVGQPKLSEGVIESILLLIAHIDPYERFILPCVKRIFRNG